MTHTQYIQTAKKMCGGALGGIFLFTVFFLNVSTSYALPATCPTDLKTGDEIKVPGKPAIYVLDKDLKPLYFPNGYVYKTYKSNYSGYKPVTQECLLALPQPPKAPFGVGYKPGSYIVRKTGETQLYAVLPGNSLAKISDGLARTLHGNGYGVRDLEYSEYNNYVCRKPDITSAKVYQGMVFKLASDSSKVWYLDTQNKLREVSQAALSVNYIVPEFTKTVPDSAVQGYAKGDMIVSGVNELMDRTQTTVDCNGNVNGGNNPPPPPPPPMTDRTPPTVSLTAPTANSTINGTVRLSANASDDTSVSRVDFLFNGTVIGSDASQPYTLDWDSKVAPNGVGVITAKAYDGAGNNATSAPVNVTVNNNVVVPQEVGVLRAEMVTGPESTPNVDRSVIVDSFRRDYYPTIFAVKVKAEKEPIELRKIKIVINGSVFFVAKDVDSVDFTYGQPTSGQLNPFQLGLVMGKNFKCASNLRGMDCSAVLDPGGNILFDPIQPGSSVTIYVRAAINAGGTARVGDTFYASVPVVDVIGYGVNSKQEIKAVDMQGNGNTVLRSPGETRIVPWLVETKVVSPAPGTVFTQNLDKGSVLGTFKIVNSGNKINLSALNFADTGSHQAGGKYSLYVSGQVDNANNNGVPFISNLLVQDNPNLNFSIPFGDLVLDGGKSIYASVIVSDTTGLNSQDSWQLGLPDSSSVRYYVDEQSLGYDNNGNGNKTDIIWSPLFAEGNAMFGKVVLQ
jgi:hypothetical protein